MSAAPITTTVSVDVQAHLVLKYEGGERPVDSKELARLGYIAKDDLAEFTDAFFGALVTGNADTSLTDQGLSDTLGNALRYALGAIRSVPPGRPLQEQVDAALHFLTEWDDDDTLTSAPMVERLREALSQGGSDA